MHWMFELEINSDIVFSITGKLVLSRLTYKKPPFVASGQRVIFSWIYTKFLSVLLAICLWSLPNHNNLDIVILIFSDSPVSRIQIDHTTKPQMLLSNNLKKRKKIIFHTPVRFEFTILNIQRDIKRALLQSRNCTT